MGFFSSIGNVFKKVAAPVAGVLGGVLGGPAGAVFGATVADSIWNGGSSGSDWQKSAYGDQMAFAREQFDFNKQYIQNQMQWRVEDAKKAGLHPMAALGLNGASFSGVSMPSIPNVSDSTFDPVELGQSVAYAATKAKTSKQQQQAFELSQMTGQEQLRGVQLDNELKQLEIMSFASRLNQTGPSAPFLDGKVPGGIDGQGDSFSNFGPTPVNLYSTARVGDVLLTVLNPDIADSLTESQLAHVSATLAREMETARNPQVTLDAFRQLKPNEQKAVAEGRAIFEYIPGVGGYMLTYPKWRSKDGLSAGGKLRF